MKPSIMLAQLWKYLTMRKLPSNIQEKLCSFITTNPAARNLETQILMYLWVVMTAEIYELVGNFILSKLSNIIDKNSIGLYRDGVFDKLSGRQIEQKKKIIKILKDSRLAIMVTSNITSNITKVVFGKSKML